MVKGISPVAMYVRMSTTAMNAKLLFRDQKEKKK